MSATKANEVLRAMLEQDLTSGEAITRALMDAQYFASFWRSEEFPAPIAHEDANGIRVLHLFTNETEAYQTLKFDSKVWLDEISLREACVWATDQKWDAVIVHFGSGSYRIGAGEFGRFASSAPAA